MEKNRYLVSVIIPVYNAERYLENCIESVLGQTIGKDKIQLILVDNASEDGSGRICDRYGKEAPGNIEVLHMERNIGPAGARNAGIPRIKGRYVTFLDADDKWESKAFAQMCKFLEKHGKKIDFAAARIKNFGGVKGWTKFDYVFEKERVINIHDDYECVATSMRGFFRSEWVRSRELDTGIFDVDGVSYVTEAVLGRGQYGAVRSAVYCLRRGTAGSKLPEDVRHRRYVRDFPDMLSNVLEMSRRMFGKPLPYAQYLVMYMLQWRIKASLPEWVDEEAEREYVERVGALLPSIEDYIISEQKYLFKEHKIFCLRMKYGEEIYSRFRSYDGGIWFHNISWCAMDNRTILTYWSHKVEHDVMRLTGILNLPFPRNCFEVFVRDSRGREYPLVYDASGEKVRYALGRECLVLRPFEVCLPLSGVQKVQFVLRFRHMEQVLPIQADKFSDASMDPPEAFCAKGGYIFSRERMSILVSPDTPANLWLCRKRLWKGLWERRDLWRMACRAAVAFLNKVNGRSDARIYIGEDRIV